MAKKKKNFEESLNELEEIVMQMESTDLPLEEAMKYYKEGIELSLSCMTQLSRAEEEVKVLTKKAEGAFMLEKFQIVED